MNVKCFLIEKRLMLPIQLSRWFSFFHSIFISILILFNLTSIFFSQLLNKCLIFFLSVTVFLNSLFHFYFHFFDFSVIFSVKFFLFFFKHSLYNSFDIFVTLGDFNSLSVTGWDFIFGLLIQRLFDKHLSNWKFKYVAAVERYYKIYSCNISNFRHAYLQRLHGRRIT